MSTRHENENMQDGQASHWCKVTSYSLWHCGIQDIVLSLAIALLQNYGSQLLFQSVVILPFHFK